MLSVWPGQSQWEGPAFGVTSFPPHFISHQPRALAGPCLICIKLIAAASSINTTHTNTRCLDFLDTTHRDAPVKEPKGKEETEIEMNVEPSRSPQALNLRRADLDRQRRLSHVKSQVPLVHL